MSREFSGNFGVSSDFPYAMVCLLLIYTRSSQQYLKVLTPIVLLNGVKAAALVVFISIVNSTKLLVLAYITAIVLLVVFFMDDINLFIEQMFAIISQDYTHPELKTLYSGDFEEKTLGSRVGKWSIAVSLVTSNIVFLLFGYGAYAGGGAMDGGLIRLFFEYGLLGITCVFWFCLKLGIRYFLIFVSVNLFIDGFISSTLSPLLIAIYLMEKKKHA